MTLAHAQLRSSLFPRLDASHPSKVVIAWEISPRALLLAPGAKVLNGHAKRLQAARLTISIDFSARTPHDQIGTCVLRSHLDARLDRDEHDQIELSSMLVGQWSLDAASDRVLVDVPGVLHAVVECDADGHAERLIYAQTTALKNALGLPGGVYDAPGLVSEAG